MTTNGYLVLKNDLWFQDLLGNSSEVGKQALDKL